MATVSRTRARSYRSQLAEARRLTALTGGAILVSFRPDAVSGDDPLSERGHCYSARHRDEPDHAGEFSELEMWLDDREGDLELQLRNELERHSKVFSSRASQILPADRAGHHEPQSALAIVASYRGKDSIVEICFDADEAEISLKVWQKHYADRPEWAVRISQAFVSLGQTGQFAGANRAG